MSFFAIYPALGGSGGGGSGITSINGDTTAAQVIAAGTGITVGTVAGTTTISASGGGTGTVTSVAVTTANGVSGSVANPTTTPAISLTLGAITPSSINASGNITGNNVVGTTSVSGATLTSTGTIVASGNITGANLSGTNTGDQIVAAGTGISVSTVGATTTVTNTAPSLGGTVTSVSVTTANGVSGSVANATTTPAISLTLGAITPTSVAASGTLSGSNFSGSSSGTNTGDQTITLTGDVTGSGTGSFAATLAATTNSTLTTLSGLTTANALTSASSLATVGTITSGTWNGSTIAINHGGTGQTNQTAAFDALSPTTSTGDLIYNNGANNVRLPVGTNGQVLATVSSAPTWITPSFGYPTANIRATEGGGTVTLTNADNKYQRFDLNAAETVVLPSTGVLSGDIWEIINPNPYSLAIQADDTSLIMSSWGDQVQLVALTNTPATSTDWAVINKVILFGRVWTPFTPIFSASLGIVTIQSFSWKRENSNLQLSGYFVTGTTTASAAPEISFPALGAGINTDTNVKTITNASGFGDWHQLGGAGGNAIFNSTFSGICGFGGGGTMVFRMWYEVGGGIYTQDVASAFLASLSSVDIPLLVIPIAEWAEV